MLAPAPGSLGKCLPTWLLRQLPALAAAATAQWEETEAGTGAGAGAAGPAARGSLKIVLITGFESFNVDLYKKAAVQLARMCPAISLRVFSDRDIGGGDAWGLGKLGKGWCNVYGVREWRGVKHSQGSRLLQQGEVQIGVHEGYARPWLFGEGAVCWGVLVLSVTPLGTRIHGQQGEGVQHLDRVMHCTMAW